MSSFVPVENTTIQIIQFDEEQMAKIQAGLVAVADEQSTTFKTKSLSDDVIELLSDTDNENVRPGNKSDDSSDCEILGYSTLGVCPPPNELLKSFSPTGGNVEEQIYFLKTDGAESVLTYVDPNSGTTTIEDGYSAFVCNDLTLTTETKSKTANDGVELSQHYETYQLDTNLPTTSKKQNEFSNIMEPNICSPTKSTKFHTFNTNEFKLHFQMQETEDDLNNDIIKLDDSSTDTANEEEEENEMDDETKMKVFELLESDAEDDRISESVEDCKGELMKKQPKNIDMLIHYNCPECDLPCGSIKKWRMHTDIEHNFNTIEKLNMRSVVGRDGKLYYQCTTCLNKLKFYTYGPLLEHRIQHSLFPNCYKCRLCFERFPRRRIVWQHLRRQHPKICKEYLSKRPSPNRHILFFCSVCNTPQENRFHWQKHLREVHNYDEVLKERFSVSAMQYGRYSCIQCKSLLQKYQSLEHSVSHDPYKAFHCELCKDFSSHSFNTCSGHIRRVHYTDYSSCKYCDMKFTSFRKRSIHEKEMHGKQSELKCDICHFQFPTVSQLLTHMNAKNHRKLK